MAQFGEQENIEPGEAVVGPLGATGWISDLPLDPDATDLGDGIDDPDADGAVVDLRHVGPGTLAGRTLRGIALQRANLAARDLQGIELERCDLSGADLRQTDVRRAWIVECRLRAADLNGLVAGGLVVIGSDLHQVSLRNADLRDTVLLGCDLRDADLAGCDLRGAVLNHVDLRGANLVGAELDDAAIDAFWDDSTVWPVEEPLGA